jgi:hypothetical protein
VGQRLLEEEPPVRLGRGSSLHAASYALKALLVDEHTKQEYTHTTDKRSLTLNVIHSNTVSNTVSGRWATHLEQATKAGG